MNTHQLEIFFHVARLLSVTKAAEHLFISQPAVSSQVKKLEQTYGVKLIEKDGRGIRLTHTGTRLYEQISHFFSKTLVDVDRLLRDSNVLTISGNYLMVHFVVPELLEKNSSLRQNNKIVVKSASSTQSLAELTKNTCDLSLISTTRPLTPVANFVATKIFADEIVLIRMKNSPGPLKSIIVSDSKKDILQSPATTYQGLSKMSVTVVDSTQDAINNVRINHDSGTLVSAKFLKYFKDEFDYAYMGTQSLFYALYRQDSLKKDLIKEIIAHL